MSINELKRKLREANTTVDLWERHARDEIWNATNTDMIVIIKNGSSVPPFVAGVPPRVRVAFVNETEFKKEKQMAKDCGFNPST
jgi:hypothetical protein